MLNDLKVSLFLAARAIKKGNKKTMIFTVLMMTILAINLLLLPSLMDEMDRMTKQQIVTKHLGHVMIEPQEGKDVIEDVDSYMKKISAFPEVIGVSAQYVKSGTAYHDDNKRASLLYFIQPYHESTVTEKKEDIVAGDFLSPRDTDGIVLGREAAGTHGALFKHVSLGGAHVGENINVTFPSGVSKNYRVKGIFSTKLIEADWDAYLTYNELENIFGIENEATQVLVRLNKNGIAENFIGKLKQMGFNEQFYVSKDKQGLALSETLGIIKSIVIIVSVVVSVVTLFIVVYINASNKKKLIGIMKALGIKGRIIISSFILQAIFYTAVGLVLGLFVTYVFLKPYFQAHPLDLPFAYVTLRIKPQMFIICISSLLVSAVIAGFLAVYQITNEKIIQVLRS